MDDLLNIVEKINDNTIILTFVDYKYIPLFDIFYSYFEKLDLKNLLVIALDLHTYNHLHKYNKFHIFYTDYNLYNKDLFWKFRLSLINYIFKSSMKNIIHTDIDCLWYKNIVEDIQKLEYDITGSIAFGFPEEFVKKYGFIMCCGFYYIKYNDNTKDFFDKIIHQNTSINDDQLLMNTYIFNNHKSISIYNDDNLITKCIETVDNLKIGIISDSIISRTYKPSLYCFHPHLPSPDIDNKIRELYAKMEIDGCIKK